MNFANSYSINIPLIILGGMLFITSCSGNKKRKSDDTKGTYIEVDLKNAKTFDVNEVANVIKYVPLETNDNTLIGSISKLYVKNDLIIVFDREYSNIFLFDQNGSFVRRIGEKGNGPSEYIKFNDICYDSASEKLYAFERFKNKMFVYSLNGNLDKVIDSQFSFNSFIKVENGYWIYSCFNKNNPFKYNLIYTDDELSRINNGYFPQKSFVNIENTTRFSEDNKNHKYFYYPSSNIIYKLSNNTIEPFLQIDFGVRTLPYNEIKNAKDHLEYDKIINSYNYAGYIENVQLSQQAVIFNCSESNLNKSIKSFKVSVDMDNKTASVYDGYKNTEGSPSLNELLYTTDKNELVYAINPSRLADKEINELNKILPSISYDSNQIIVFYKIK